MKPTTSLSNHAFWLATIVVLLALPGAAADAGCVDHAGVELDFYLLEAGDGSLGLSGLAPSARNETGWKVRVHSDGVHEAEQRIRMAFPSPEYALDETIDVTGYLGVEAQRLEHPGPLQVHIGSQPTMVDVLLVEGDRSSSLGNSYGGGCWTMPTWSYSCSPHAMDLLGAYPGHGSAAGPHTHGDGADAERPLYLSDLEIEMVFRVGAVSPPIPVPMASQYEFTVTIDGNSFLHLVAVGPAEDPSPPLIESTPAATGDEAGEAGSIEESPSPPPDEPNDPEDDPNTSSVGGTALAGLNLLTALSAVGAGSVALAAGAWAVLRRRPK